MSRRMRKADEAEGKNVQTDVAPTDHDEATEGINEDSGETAEKSEDAASDSDHISHPRPDGEETQQGGVSKSDDDDEDDWGGNEDEEAEKAENTDEEEGALTSQAQSQRNAEEITAKSLTAGDLDKSLTRLQRYADRGSVESRKNSLLRKAQAGQTLSKSERSELFDLLGNKPQERPALAKSVTQGLRNNNGLQKALDVSEYLAEQHSELTKSLGALSTHVERSDARQHEFNLVLAKAVADVGNLVKAVAEQMTVIGNQPARGPKSKGVGPGQVLQKGMAGGAPQGDTLSKSDVLDTMEKMLVDSIQKGGNGIHEGEDISTAITKFESFNQISPAMHAEVLRRAKTGGQS